MRQTLLYLNLEFLGLPMFGIGWLFFGWLVFSAIFLFWQTRQHGWQTARGQLLMMVIVALAIYASPLLLERDNTGEILGLPVRGYGFFTLLGLVSGVGLAAHRARKMGLNPDLIFSLAFWMFVAGIAGARAFYVIQKWPEFRYNEVGDLNSTAQTLSEIFKFTEGGLVVYGSFIGAMAAAVIFMRRNRLPVLAIADLIMPSMVLGLAFGRLGCLMNGCCWGGVCEQEAMGMCFPQGSPPYIDQLFEGRLLGLEIERNSAGRPEKIINVVPGSLAAERRILAGTALSSYRLELPPRREFDRRECDPDQVVAILTPVDQAPETWTIRQLPTESLPVYPTQILAAVNGFLLCFLLLAIYPFRSRDGQVFAIGLKFYAVTRFVLEIIRTDEAGQLGTSFTISQWISMLMILISIGLWIGINRISKGLALPPSAKTAVRT